MAREREQINVDHAAVGGWLLERWHFPDRIQQGVAASHDPGRVSRSTPNGSFVRCVAMSSLIAEVFLTQSGDRRFDSLADTARQHLGVNKEVLGEILTEITLLIPDVEGVFETQILAQTSSDTILDEAREALMLRNLAALQTVDNLQEKAVSLETRTKELEESSRRDTLTGLYNRAHLDQFMEEAFTASRKSGQPLSIAFADLDEFKLVNDTYGHQVGDQILSTTASILSASVRSTDIVARYGGEEFIVVFPDTDKELVKTICERIVRAFQETRHDVGVRKDLPVTISVGVATHGDGKEFEALDSFVKAADKALYTAKLQGRNRSVPYDTVAELKVAQM